MRKRLRRFAWPMLALVVVMGLTAGAAAAHEGRPVGDYRFIVGWLEEPTYEGHTNAISVRVNKVVEGGTHDDSDGHHGRETGSARTSQDNESAHPSEGGSHGAASGNDHDGGHHGPDEAASAMSVEVEATIDPVSGVNIHTRTSGFTFAPERVNEDHVEGEGHAHIYVDGAKISRVYTPWFHLDGLNPGRYEVEIRLNTNDHSEYTWGGEVVKASVEVDVPESGKGMAHHGAASTEADSSMSVDIRVEPDPLGGANLFITDTTGFAFAAGSAGGHHVSGEGHAHVYVNGVKVSRVYGNAFQLGKMAEGRNEVRVTLNTNDHSEYTWEGEPVQSTVQVEILEGMGGAGYGTAGTDAGGTSHGKEHDLDRNGDDGDHPETEDRDNSRSIQPRGFGKLLASMAGQAREESVVPVEGLEGSLRVEVRHFASGERRTLDLEAVAEDPGHYTAALIPTAPGVYEFRVFGDLEGLAIDETFVSTGGGGGFDDVQTPAELQFPVVLPEVREIESGVRGALDTAQQAQDAALAAQENHSGNALVIVALVVGIVGTVLGAGGLFLGLRRRDS